MGCREDLKREENPQPSEVAAEYRGSARPGYEGNSRLAKAKKKKKMRALRGTGKLRPNCGGQLKDLGSILEVARNHGRKVMGVEQ